MNLQIPYQTSLKTNPGQTKIIEFIDEFTNSLSDLSQNKKVYYILGDFTVILI